MTNKIYTTTWCPYCKAAKRLLKSKNIPFEEINIEEEGISREKLAGITGGRTVPQIVLNGEFIGGYDNLAAMNTANKL